MTHDNHIQSSKSDSRSGFWTRTMPIVIGAGLINAYDSMIYYLDWNVLLLTIPPLLLFTIKILLTLLKQNGEYARQVFYELFIMSIGFMVIWYLAMSSRYRL
jgi:hypothetical protein